MQQQTLEQRLGETECTSDEAESVRSAIHADFGPRKVSDVLREASPTKNAKDHEGPDL